MRKGLNNLLGFHLPLPNFEEPRNRPKKWQSAKSGVGRVGAYTVHKGLAISRPQPGCQWPNSPWPGKINPIPDPEGLVQKNPGIS